MLHVLADLVELIICTVHSWYLPGTILVDFEFAIRLGATARFKTSIDSTLPEHGIQASQLPTTKTTISMARLSQAGRHQALGLACGNSHHVSRDSESHKTCNLWHAKAHCFGS